MTQSTIDFGVGKGGGYSPSVSFKTASQTTMSADNWSSLLDRIADIIDLSPDARARLNKVRKDAEDAHQIIESMRRMAKDSASHRVSEARRRIDELKKLLAWLRMFGSKAALRELLRELKALSGEVAGAVQDGANDIGGHESEPGVESSIANFESLAIAQDVAKEGLPGSDGQDADPNAAEAAAADPALTAAISTPDGLHAALEAATDSAHAEDHATAEQENHDDHVWFEHLRDDARQALADIRQLIERIRAMLSQSHDPQDHEALHEADSAIETAEQAVG